jgi:cell division transport system permease protein
MRASHIFEEARRGALRNRGTFILSAAVQGVCLMLLTLFILLTINVTALVRAAGRQVELNVFLSDPGDEARLKTRVAAIEGVTGTRYVSKDDALIELRSDLGEDTTLLAALGDNPLPASIRAAIHPDYANAARLDEIEKKIALLPGVDEVWSGKDTIDRLNRITRTALIIDILMLVIVSCAVAFIVFQTVEGSIVSRRHEIEIMELVGAARSAVRLPFVIEGTAQGLAGGIAAVVLVFVVYRFVAAAVAAPVFPVWAVLVVNIGLGGLLGLAGSVIALSRIQHPHQAKPQAANPKSQTSPKPQ